MASGQRGWNLHPDGGFGLIGMEERVGLVGGELRVESAPGRGTQITITVPLGDALAPANSANSGEDDS